LVCHLKGRILIEGVTEKSAEKNICTRESRKGEEAIEKYVT
jgi:hypothetical protein